MATEHASTKRKRTLVAGGGVVVLVVAGASMLAWANGAFGSPAVDRVGSFHEIEAGFTTTTHARSTTRVDSSTTRAPNVSAPVATDATRPAGTSEAKPNATAAPATDTTGVDPAVGPTPTRELSPTSFEPESVTSGVRATSSTSRADNEIEPPDGDRGRDD